MEKYTILPKSSNVTVSDKVKKEAAVIAHLYYEERFSNSFSYLLNVPEDISVYIITANPGLHHLAQEAIRKQGLSHITLLTKPNIGRDFGALLVTSKQILTTHRVIGFIHDKMSHRGEHRSLGDIWENCLFESILGSHDYIMGIIRQFEAEPKLGLLSAPIPAEEHLLGLAGVLWTENYERTLELLRRHAVEYTPSELEDPLTIGSAFWFRTEALRKLLDYPWSYEDFPGEPMPNDGTISHALERALASFCIDAGYQARYVMNMEFAEKYVAIRNEQLTQAMRIIRQANLMAFTGDKLDLPLALERLKEVKNGGSRT